MPILKKIAALTLSAVLLLFPLGAYAQDTFTGEVPEGMEAIRIGGSGWLIIPKGAKTKKVGAQIIVEGTKEYMARRIEETDTRLTALEEMVARLTAEIEKLKSEIAQKQNQTADPSSE